MGLSKFIKEEFYVPVLHFFDSLEDRKRGVNTRQNFELHDLGIANHFGNKYQPVGYRRLKEILTIASLICPQSTFVDIGCGLGRPILVALELGFQSAIGIDISYKLILLCKKNTANRSKQVKLICTDIQNYRFPSGVLTVFLFNPFDKDRLENLVSKIDKSNSKGLIIYFNPKYKEVFKEKKLIRKLKWRNFGFYEEQCNFYQM